MAALRKRLWPLCEFEIKGSNMRHQQGATLIVALVLLAIVTLVGAAGIRGTSLEMKMIASARDRAMAFEAAEATLRKAEADLIASGRPAVNEDGVTEGPALTLQNITNVYGATCNTETNKGKCFKGEIKDPLEPYKSCQLFKDGETNFTPFWEDKNNFADTSVNAAVDGSNNKTVATKYLVEFMCFTIKERGLKGTIDDKETGDEDLIYMPLFRITAFAEGLGKRAKVMAQSMVKVNIE